MHTDIDECEQQTDNCDHICENTIGSFDCGCIVGYELTSDLRTCRGQHYLQYKVINKSEYAGVWSDIQYYYKIIIILVHRKG